jgi:hypothetical protein
MMQAEISGLDAPAHRPASLSKRGFAEEMGVSAARVSQWVAAGLPLEPNGRVNVEAARRWVDANIDPNRRRAACDDDGQDGGDYVSPRARKTIAEAEIARLKAERLAGRLLDRGATLRVVESRARAERDALIGWVNRAAAAVAVATGADLAAVTAVLDREVRDHLRAMAALPVELPNERG